MKKYIYGHTSPETAFVVEGYPWGFRLKTTIRYWIESKKGFGQRFCSQTINPKTGLWCKPNKSTYYALGVMYLDENEYTKWESLTLYCGKEEAIKFVESHRAKFDEFQLNQIKGKKL